MGGKGACLSFPACKVREGDGIPEDAEHPSTTLRPPSLKNPVPQESIISPAASSLGKAFPGASLGGIRPCLRPCVSVWARLSLPPVPGPLRGPGTLAWPRTQAQPGSPAAALREGFPSFHTSPRFHIHGDINSAPLLFPSPPHPGAAIPLGADTWG